MEILIVREPIDEAILAELEAGWHKTLVKGVADIKTGAVALGGEWHKEAREVLVQNGSDAKNIWGFRIHPSERGAAALEYNSQINFRPLDGNFTADISDAALQKTIRKLVALAVPFLDL